MGTQWLASGADVGDSSAGDWRRQWIFTGSGLKKRMETSRLASGAGAGDWRRNGDLAAGEWSWCWGLETTMET